MSGKVGAPRRPEVIERDERVLRAVRELGSARGVHVRRLRSHCEVNQRLLYHSLTRLQRLGLVERRDGYLWWPTKKR